MSLFIEKVRQAERIYVDHRCYQFEWMDCEGAGYSFECDADGEFITEDWDTGAKSLGFENMPLAAQESVIFCFSEEGAEQIAFKGIIEWQHSYRQDAIGICKYCGAEVTLSDPMDNVCTCGAIYNMSGQECKCLARDVDYLDAGEVYDED